MLGALGFAGISLQAYGQQFLSHDLEVSSSGSVELQDAPELMSKGGSASQTGKVKTVHVSEFSLGLGVTAQLTATRTSNQLNIQNIVGTTPSAGFLATFQQQIRPLVGYDINFGYTKLTENYERNLGTFDPSH
jgi:hypothetical protein